MRRLSLPSIVQRTKTPSWFVWNHDQNAIKIDENREGLDPTRVKKKTPTACTGRLRGLNIVGAATTVLLLYTTCAVYILLSVPLVFYPGFATSPAMLERV